MNQSHGIPHETLEQMEEVWKNHPGLDQAVLYGSRAKGRQARPI